MSAHYELPISMRTFVFACALVLASSADTPLPVSKHWTLQLELLPGGGDFSGNLYHANGLSFDSKNGMLLFSFTTDLRIQPLSVGLPVRLIAKSESHEFVLRYGGYRVDLFVDGVLVDQEWPMGMLVRGADSGYADTARITGVDVVDRLVSEEEIEAKAGGHEAVVKRENAMFGPPLANVQYWHPRGWNTSAGDAMPFFHEGVFHIFFLRDRRHHGSKWGLGAHEWWHVSSIDLAHWKEEPPALRVTDESEGSICTGSVFFHDRRYYAFYATRALDRSERLGIAASSDGMHFEKLLPTPFAEPTEPYRRGPNRDPFVFRDGDHFQMLVTAELAHPDAVRRGGALEQLTSTDLKSWSTDKQPLLVPGYSGGQPECSDLFFWRGWYYLLFGQDGQTHYRMAKTARGPWITPGKDALDGPEARVMKTAPFTGDRRIGVAFVTQGNWGGDLLLRELVQNADGTLGTKFLRELTPAGSYERVISNSDLDASATFHMTSLGELPQNFQMKATLNPTPGTAEFGLTLRSGAGMTNGLELMFRQGTHDVQWISTEAGSLGRSEAILQGMDCSKPLHLEIVVKDDIFDVSINGVRTLVHRAAGLNGSYGFVFARSGGVTLSGVRVAALAPR